MGLLRREPCVKISTRRTCCQFWYVATQIYKKDGRSEPKADR
jgi:hypothetical protein